MKYTTILKIIYLNLKLNFQKKCTPYKVLLQLTNDCNSKCTYCKIWKINQSEPSKKLNEITPTDLLPFFQAYGKNIYWLALGGGEISLYQDIPTLLKYISENCPQLSLITFTSNGLVPDKILEVAKLIRLTLPAADFFITLSLDGDEELHNNLRGVADNYQKVQESFLVLKKNNFSVQWGATVNNSNAEYFSKSNLSHIKAISLVHDAGIYNLKFNVENMLIYKALKNIIQNYKIHSFGEIVEYLFLKLGLNFLENKRHILPIPCSVLETSIHITPYGDVSPCMFMPHLGNIKKNDIFEILNSRETRKIMDDIKNSQCPKCWMNCYAPHSMMRHPLKTLWAALWK